MISLITQTLGFVQMARPVTGLIAVLGAGVAYYSGTDTPSLSIALYLAAALFCITSAGFVINDYFDIEKDSVNEPWRALPSGRVSKQTALIGACLLFLVGLGAASQLGAHAFLLALLNVSLLVVYSKLLTISGTLCNLITAYLTASLIAFAGFSAGSLVNLWAVMAFIFFYSLSRELVFDVQDLPGDQTASVSSLAVIHGTRTAFVAAWIMVFCALVVWLYAASLSMSGMRVEALIFVLLSVVLMCKGLYSYHVAPSKANYQGYISLTRWGYLLAMPAIYLAR
jgi:geranylgeranylglycerol-phosphate geranylgeranyltransferase